MIDHSEVGFNDMQVVLLSKAINKRFVIGYENSIQTIRNIFKKMINFTQFLSISLYISTSYGINLSYINRFDR